MVAAMLTRLVVSSAWLSSLEQFANVVRSITVIVSELNARNSLFILLIV
jgi:hypothetical protein